MIDLNDLLNTQSRQNIGAERLRLYCARAATFLRGQLGPQLAARSDAELRAMAGAAHAQGQKRGFRSEAEMLSYLIATTLLGLRFEEDPQYRAMLRDAGWIDAEGGLVDRPNLTLLLAHVDEYLDAVAADDAALGDRIDAFARIYRAAPTAADAGHVADWLAALWPARAAWVGPQGVQAVAQAHLRLLRPLQVPLTDGLALSGLHFRLGAFCLRDPQYGWLRRALEEPAAHDDERRHRLGQAVIAEISARQEAVA